MLRVFHDRLVTAERPARVLDAVAPRHQFAHDLVAEGDQVAVAALVVDEPFVGLDAAGREAFLGLLDEAAQEGATLVVATHDPAVLDRFDKTGRVARALKERGRAITLDQRPRAEDDPAVAAARAPAP